MSQQASRYSRCLLVAASLILGFGIAAAVSSVSAGQTAASEVVSVKRGKALFTGVEPLAGRIREHQDTMPAAVVTCTNCHASHNQAALKGSDAPVLSANFLNERRSRRHGPESAYDERTFCRVMRTSMDPVYVLLDHTMPSYALSDAQCQSLWRYLQEPDEADSTPGPSRP